MFAVNGRGSMGAGVAATRAGMRARAVTSFMVGVVLQMSMEELNEN